MNWAGVHPQLEDEGWLGFLEDEADAIDAQADRDLDAEKAPTTVWDVWGV